ncbi:MAG: carboxypeptidase M32 [Ardenticatenaceae bacterium]|nr:carboxypeptidase M32 [Ardenticatenaceae bacterium]MBL1130570.1 carboxypeptidase M32 [Chloroflexota bacterium]
MGELSVEKKLQELKTRLLEIDDLTSAASVLSWDQTTYMPPAGAPSRGRQMATLGRIAHEKRIDPEIGRLLDALEPWAETLPYDSDEASLIRVTRHDYEQAIKVPPRLLAELNEHAAAAYQLWTQARPANDFTAVQDSLAKTLDYSRQIANCFPGYDHIADPLIDFADRDMKAESVRALFAELRQQLVPIAKAIAAQEPADDSCLKQNFPEEKQLAFGLMVAQKYGYDLNRGRQDKTHHPFMTSFSVDDVRITTRVKENDLSEALFSTLHETGHALYELGVNQDLDGSPLAGGTSAGVHESQSRLWENLVGRSRPFWNHYYAQLQAAFPDQLKNVSQDTFYRAINKVQPSLIRTDADEVTYNLHVMIRFDLELALLEGTLAVQDLPEAWHARYEADLGVRAPSDVDGVLQDVHWYAGTVGGSFQGYTLGNVMSALFFEQALRAHPAIPAEIEQGEFGTLHGWLRENIYRHGRKFTANELIERVTGGPLTTEPYIRYLRTKYGELYQL